jgi:outer membrane protein assembly factor BamD
MNNLKLIICFLVVFLLSCKSEFEALRTSNQPEKIYKAANDYYDKKEYDRAIALYDIVIQFYRGKKEAEDLFYKYAYAHYNINDFILASTYFKNFATTFTNSPNKIEADFMSSYSNYKLSPNYKLDQSYTEKAILGFEQFINSYPGTERAEEANRLIDDMRKNLSKSLLSRGISITKLVSIRRQWCHFKVHLKIFQKLKKLKKSDF